DSAESHSGRPVAARSLCRRPCGAPDRRVVITLALDAATYRGTVAVLDDERVIVERSAPMRDRDAEQLMPAVDLALRDAGVDLRSLQRIVCGAGPGSFTSLRIAASLAKGLAVGRDVP